MPTQENQFNAFNYLVPATGTTQGYAIQTDFSALTAQGGYSRNWQSRSIDAKEFHPSGVIIDNTRAKAALTVTILETGQTIVAKAGQFLALQYPAPVNHSVNVLSSSGTAGDGNASVIFVDYPVIPIQFLASPLGKSGSGNVDGTGTQIVVPAGFYSQHMTVQNRDAANDLLLSFNTPAGAADFKLSPGQSMTFPINGFNNALYGRSSGAGTAFAIIGA